MPRLLFLTRKDDRPNFDTAETMMREMAQAQTSNIEYAGWFMEDLIFAYDSQQLTVFNGITKEPLDQFDGIFLLAWFKEKTHQDVAVSVSKIAESKGLKILNTEALHSRSYSKLSQQVMAVLHGVNTTPFVFCLRNELILNNLDALSGTYPLVAKTITAARGNDNFKLDSVEALHTCLMNHENDHAGFIVQHFVPNDGDFRLLVMGGEVTLGIKRVSQSESHLNNTSKGGTAELVDVTKLDPKMLRQCVTVSKFTHREVTGVDVIIHNQTGQFYFLEVNNMPQLSTGSLVSEKMQALDDFFAKWLAS